MLLLQRPSASQPMGQVAGRMTPVADQVMAQGQGAAECVANAHAGRGHAKEESGDWEGAIADFTAAIALDPRHADADVSRGLLKAGMGDRQGASKDFDQAIAIHPNDGKAYWNRGVSKSILGDKIEGCLDYRKASKLGELKAASHLVSVRGAWCRALV